MRVLVDGIPYTIGGIGTLVVNIADYNHKINGPYEFEFLVPPGSAYIPILQRKGYTYYVVPKLRNFFAYRKVIKQVVTNKSYDFLWYNNTSKANLTLPLFAKKYGNMRIIVHPHGVAPEEHGIKRLILSTLNQLHERKLFQLVDIPFACAEEAADYYYRNNQALRKKVTIIRNGIDAEQFAFSEGKRAEIRAALGLSDDDVLLCAVGRLTAVKNYSFLINLINRLDSHYKLMLIGEGEDRPILEAQIEEDHLQNRTFLLGKQSNVSWYLSAADIFLMPSFHEGMPFSAIEAQASGLPCLISDQVSEEVAITDLVQFIPLELNKWSEVLLINKTRNRVQYAEKIANAGYSIDTSYGLFRQIITTDD